MKPRRNTQEETIMFKRNVIDRCLARNMLCKEGAKLLSMHPKAFSRLKKNYKENGITALVSKPPGPKPGKYTAANRTPTDVEDMVVAIALKHPYFGPIALADNLLERYSIKLDSTTIWRILKRTKTRYTREYRRWKQEPKLYCLETPGIELQLDACYPWGRGRKLCVFDAIDDCSRYVYGKIYNIENDDNAIDFVKHLINNVPFQIQSLRVDNRYGKKFVKFCECVGINVIYNDPYTPKQNGKIERFHKTLKRELFWRYCAYHEEQESLQYKLNLYLKHYNYNRKHSGYGMDRVTPTQKLIKATLNNYSLSLIYPQKVTLSMQQYKT
jgi:transposase InsO family protein